MLEKTYSVVHHLVGGSPCAPETGDFAVGGVASLLLVFVGHAWGCVVEE
jgi:hypothetical protein